MGFKKKVTKKSSLKFPSDQKRYLAKPQAETGKKTAVLTDDFLQTYQELNHLLLLGSDPEKLLSQVCKILTGNKAFFYAWIALFNNNTRTFDRFAQAGLVKTFNLIIRQIQTDHLPICLKKTLQQNKMHTIRDPLYSCPPCPLVLDQNYQSWCLPLLYRNHYYGTLVLAVSKTFNANKTKLALIQEIATCIAAACYRLALEQSQTENKAALSSSQEQTQNLFASMLDGLAIFDVVYDYNGKAIDYVLRDANPAFAQYMKISTRAAIGKNSGFFLSRGITPHLYTFLKVAETGTPATFEDYYQYLDQHFRISVFAPQKGSFIAIYSNISEKKKLEFALSEKEERIRLALEAANQGFWEWQLKNQRIQISPSFFSMLGFTQPKDACLPFEHLEKMISLKDKDAAFTTVMKHIQKTSENFEVEVRMHNRVHVWQWFLIRGKVIERDMQNNPVRIAGTYLNITARKQSEELHYFQREFALDCYRLSDLDEFLHQCLTNILTISIIDCVGIYILDENNGLQLAAHKGFSPEFVKATSHYAFGTPQAQLVMQGKAIYTHHAQLKFPKNSVREQKLIKAFAMIPIANQKKVFGCINLASHTLNEVPKYLRQELEIFSAYIGNIILRIKTQIELTLSEERYRNIYDHSPIGIVLHADNGQVINVNQACLDIFGTPSSDHIQMINLFENPLLSSKEKATLLNGEPVRKNTTFDFKQAGALGIKKTSKFGKLHLELHIIPLGKSVDHPPTGFLSQIQDVTKRKEAGIAPQAEQ
ncbi:PAS domain S-box protein [bacterium]|nr:PAS domain S-box protein [bacterium]